MKFLSLRRGCCRPNKEVLINKHEPKSSRLVCPKYAGLKYSKVEYKKMTKSQKLKQRYTETNQKKV